MRRVFFVLLADEFDQISIEHDPLMDLDRPGLRISLRVFHGDFDFEMPIIGPLETFRHFAGFSQRTPLNVEPYVVSETSRLYHQRVAIPLTDRIAIPPRLRILRKRTPIH